MLVRIAFEALDPRILPDMGVKVTFLREEDEAAPANGAAGQARAEGAVWPTPRDSFVFVVAGAADDLVERRAVTVGGTDGDRVEVSGALRREIEWWSRRPRGAGRRRQRWSGT